MKCRCEHADHWDRHRFGDKPSHEYLGVPAGEQRAQHVGPVCDRCAETHMKDYLIGEGA